MFLRRTVPAASLPLSVMDAKDHLRVTDSRDDYLVEGYLRAALEAVGEMSGRVLAAETWAMSAASASGDVPLPKCPVISLTSIEYFDANETAQTANVADFYLFKDDDKAFLRPKAGKSWPTTASREDAITITFTVGYSTLPHGLKSAVLLMLGHLYENREGVADGGKTAIPLGVESLVNLHRIGWVAA